MKNSAVQVSKFEKNFRCPICQSQMKVIDLKSIVCANKHTFDFAKQGYINMLHHGVKTQYDKALFQARRDIIIESDLYRVLHEQISEVMKENVVELNKHAIILDADSGEGSHLHRILEGIKTSGLTGMGLDISKEGIRLAASNYKNTIWLVGDLANIPIENHALKVILNILSPANYQEFKRILVQDGLVIKVVPGPDYLKELREVLFGNTEKEAYENSEIVALFNTHFHSTNRKHVKYKKYLSRTELMNLVRMSPLSWNTKPEDIKILFSHNVFEITIDLDILIGKIPK